MPDLRGLTPQTQGVRMLQDHRDPSGLLLGRDVSAGHEPGFWNDDLGTHWLPGAVQQRKR